MAMKSMSWFLHNYRALCEKAKIEMQSDTANKDKIAYRYATRLGWYDWFCKDSALIDRTLKYGALVEKIVDEIPILGRNTFIEFSQRGSYDGYLDYIMISTNTKRPFGYGIRKDRSGYYVYRIDRHYGADYKINNKPDKVIDFIKKDVIIWLGGGLTSEYKSSANNLSYTQSRIKASKPFSTGEAVNKMRTSYVQIKKFESYGKSNSKKKRR